MKHTRSLIGKTLTRLTALLLAFALAPASLCLDVYAEEAKTEDTQPEAAEAQKENNEADDDSGTMTIYKNGEAYETEISSGGDWPDNAVKGDLTPVNKALSVDDYNSGVPTFNIKDELYTLTVATGINPGKTVKYFAIRYTDENGAAQTKYIFLTQERMDMVNDYLKNMKITKPGKVWRSTTITGLYVYHEMVGPEEIEARYEYRTIEVEDRDAVENVKSNFYEIESIVDNYVDGEVEVSTDSMFSSINDSHKDLKSLGYTINEDIEMNSMLGAWSIDELLFKTDTPIKTVDRIDVFMTGGKWSVQGMTVSKVNTVGGYGEYGFYSGKYFLALGKQRLAELTSRKGSAQNFNADGDTLINVGGDNSEYFGLRQVSGTADNSTSLNDLYSFRLDFTDLPDGGIEALLRNRSADSDPTNGNVCEHMALEISYRDRNGWARTVTMPVLLSVLGQYKRSGDNVKTMGLAQRGDTLAFTANLPEYDSLITTKLYVGKAARDKLKADGGIVPEGTSKQRNKLFETLDSDYIRIAGVSMYKGTCRLSNTPDGQDAATGKALASYTCVFSFYESDPILYTTTNNEQGIRINAGASDTFKLVEYNKKAALIGAKYAGNVLIRIKTDDLDGAEPSGTTRIRLNYQDTSGSELSSPNYKIADEVNNYLGCWPSSTNVKDNYAYWSGVQRGNIVEFPVQLPDVAAVNSVEINVGGDSDEWQIAGMSVAVVRNVGKRRIYAKSGKAGSFSTDYIIVRDMEKTVIPPFPINLKLLITPEDSFAFNTGTGTVITAREADYNEVLYSMSYQQTKENYGYARDRKTYDVTVKVADDPDAGNINGDSGSSNHFYFQLRFDNGSSAYVLANQQLSSDAFRAGHEESFAIKVNRDYGNVSAIRIIPQDISEDNDVFDKLNVEYITVTERTGGGSSDQFVFDDIGWIDIDYHDKSEDSAVKPRAGRSVGELAKSFKVSYKQKVVNLFCEINTLPRDTDYADLEASVSCDLVYIDTDMEPHTMSFDVVSRLASYMNKTPRKLDGAADGSNAALYTSMGTISDPQWMLRPNHTDRFILPPIANLRQVKSMTFKVTNRTNKTCKWVIGGVSLSRIETDSGVVTLAASTTDTKDTSNAEYIRSMKTRLLCERVPKNGRDYEDLTLLPGDMQKATIYFDEHTVTWADNSAWTSSVSKLPETTNDELNVFLFPSARSQDIDDVSVSLAMQYTIANSRIMQIKQDEMNISGSGTADAMFYFTGLSAAGMKNLSSMSIQCKSSTTAFDHAIVQQVREGVVIMTYTLLFDGATATLGLKAQPIPSTRIYDHKKQTLMVSFGTSTREMALFGLSDDNLNPNDVAVCLKYRSTLDEDGDYYSPYVYLTDAGINKIYPGMMAEIPFEVPYLAEITGYRIVSFGNVKANVESAFALNYSYAEGDANTVKLEECYSFTDSFDTTNKIRELKAAKGMTGEDTVIPLDLYITTAEATEANESGINVPVAVEINYLDSKSADQTMSIKDIRQYIQYEPEPGDESKWQLNNDGERTQFKTGERAHIRLFVRDCTELTSINIKPSEGIWKIDKIEAYKLEEELVNRKVDMEFNEKGATITLKKVTLTTSVTVDENYKGIVENHEKNIKVDGGKIVSGTVLISNSEEGFDIRVDMLANDILTDITDEVASAKEETFAVTIPENVGTVAETYTITIWSVDNPTIKDVINVTVPVVRQRIVPDEEASDDKESGDKDKSDSSKDEEEPGSEDEKETEEPEEPAEDTDTADSAADEDESAADEATEDEAAENTDEQEG